MTYRERLLSLIRHVVKSDLEAWVLLDEIMDLNQNTLQDKRDQMYESGVTMTPTAALARMQTEMGPPPVNKKEHI